jgi:hypothetical protein
MPSEDDELLDILRNYRGPCVISEDDKNVDKIISREYSRQQYKRNKEKILKCKKYWYILNKEEIREYRKKWVAENKDYYKNYYEKNKDKIKEKLKEKRKNRALSEVLDCVKKVME